MDRIHTAGGGAVFKLTPQGTETVLLHVWGHKGADDRQLLKQLVHWMRQKIKTDPANPQILQTAASASYKLIAE